MERILNRWYVGLVILPILINYLTTYLTLPKIFEDWRITIIGMQSILILIFAYELMLRFKKDEPLESDKEVIKRLLASLDIDEFQTDIYEQNSWYGYKKEAIRKIFDFTEKSGLLTNRTSDKKLNKLVDDLKNSLDKFTEYSSKQLFDLHLPDWYLPDKASDSGIKRAKIAEPIMNKMTTDSYNKLLRLITYLKKNKYM